MSPLRYMRVLLNDRPLPDTIDQLLRRLAQPGAPRPLVLETRAQAGQFIWLLGAPDARLPELRSLMTHLVGNSRLVSVDANLRASINHVWRVDIAAPGLPLDRDRVEAVTHAIYEAFARLRGHEAFVLQTVLGRGFAPRLLHPEDAPVAPSLAQVLGLGSVPDPRHGRSKARLEARAAEVGLALTVRIGVSAVHPDRARGLLAALRDALRLLEAPGARLRVTPESPGRLDEGRANWVHVIRLSTPEAVPLLGWPTSDRDLPGLPLHPRRALAPLTIESKQLVFAATSTPGDERVVGISPDALLQHLVITGPTGSGKSTVIAAIAEQWIRSHRPLALLDPKRQLVDHLLARLPHSAAGRVAVLDPTEKPVLGFNPLDATGRNPDVVVDSILASLRVIFDDGWGPRTEDLLLAGLRTLALAGSARGEPYTLVDLPRVFTDAALRRDVVAAVQFDAVLATFWAGFDSLSETARAAQVAAPLNKLRRFLLRPGLVAVLGQTRPRFRVRDLFQGDQALLVPLNDSLVGPGSAQLLGSLLVAELFQAAQERALEDDPRSRPGLIAIDEAQRFIHLPTALEDALATSRSYGVAWLAAHQYRAQLSPTLRAGFDSNARTKLVYASSYEDARDYARLARTLTVDDFMTLDPHELYLSVVHDGASSPWFAARALPPRRELGFAQLIRDASRARFGATLTPSETAPAAPAAPNHQKPRTR